MVQIHSPLEGDYLTIHPNPTGKPKYYGTSLKEANAPPKWSEYPGVGYLTVCFKTRQTVDDHHGYSAEIYPTVATTTNEPGSETYEYYSPSQGRQKLLAPHQHEQNFFRTSVCRVTF